VDGAQNPFFVPTIHNLTHHYTKYEKKIKKLINLFKNKIIIEGVSGWPPLPHGTWGGA
jgi:hypothetical protein